MRGSFRSFTHACVCGGIPRAVVAAEARTVRADEEEPGGAAGHALDPDAAYPLWESAASALPGD
ncbi:hypothetical protein [Streptomyces sp. WAC 04229]|uniref:hypothetical protein n=1 Tax=Streptomyces sp. WAC 04229 TaxID=2203206 RepID=UPI000F736830|nr:hypothetical protein [Streptomyces sp. WAC 04229]